jgi:NAD+ kinase
MIMSTMPKVVVLAPPDKPHVADALKRLEPVLRKHADILAIDQAFEYSFEHSPVDLVVVLGGDGSILQSARQMGRFQKPVLGVNLGRLGFLAALSPERLVDVWPEVCKGRYSKANHLMFECKVYREGSLIHQHLGLNEVSILGGPPYSMLQIDLYVDQQLATTYNCDGLIISTPVGSTAHNLSAGGPILRKTLQAFVISPISPHTLTMRPFVDTADRVFELKLRHKHPTASVVVDGRVACPIDPDLTVRIQRAEKSFQLISVPGQNDYKTLREKLGWSGSPSGQVEHL